MKKEHNFNRRQFLKHMSYGSAGLIIMGSFGFRIFSDADGKVIKAIRVDFDKCAGCRTCESVCAAFNHPLSLDGELVESLGNPYFSNISVYHYNPDVDVPVTCAICPDAPCIEACPVEPDVKTGRRALYRDENMTIKNDPERCIGCAQCAEACSNQRAGVIHFNEKSQKPERMCTLCSGDPQCVKQCPYGALEYMEMPNDRDLSNLHPDKLAEALMEKWYHLKY